MLVRVRVRVRVCVCWVLSQVDGPISAGVNPMFVATHTIKGQVFCFSVDTDDDAPGVRSFRIDAVDKRLVPINKVSTGGNGPCHLIVVTQGKPQLLPPAPPYYPFLRGKPHTRGNIWTFTVG